MARRPMVPRRSSGQANRGEGTRDQWRKCHTAFARSLHYVGEHREDTPYMALFSGAGNGLIQQ
jgi:hypothetical protein